MESTKKKINLDEIQKNIDNKKTNISKEKNKMVFDNIDIKKTNRDSIRAVSLIDLIDKEVT